MVHLRRTPEHDCSSFRAIVAVPRPQTPELIGRGHEQAQLRRRLDALLDGRGSIVAVSGAPGVGKTALAANLADAATRRGIAATWVRCSEIERIRPFGVLLDALECRVNHPDPLRRRVAETVVASAATDADPFRFELDASWRFPVQDAIVDLLVEWIERQPQLLVIDDVQWADVGTLGVLLAIARRCAASPLALLWTIRTSFTSAATEQILDRHRAHVTELALQPLAPEDATTLGRTLAGAELDALQQLRVEAARGNPLYIAAAVGSRPSAETGAAPAGDAHAPVASTDAIANWITSVPPATVELLQVAAVLGTAFGSDLLADITGEDHTAVAERLVPAVHHGLVIANEPEPDGAAASRYRFTHDLIRRTIEADLPVALRRPLHREAARRLAEGGADVELVAHHLANGARPGDEDAAEQVRVACLQIVRRDAAAAAELLRRAAELCLPGSSAWASVMADRVVALQWAGRPADAVALADEVTTQPMSVPDLARVRVARAACYFALHDFALAAAEYQSLGTDPEIDAGLRALIKAELATLEAWGLDRTQGRALGEEARAAGRASGMLQAELQALCALSTMELFDGNVERAVELAREAVTSGRRHQSLNPARELYLALALANADQLDEARIWMTSGEAAADAEGDLWVVSRHQLARMSISLNHGDWDEAIADVEAIITIHNDTGMASGMLQAPSTGGIIAVRRNAPAEEVARYRDLATGHANPFADGPGLFCHGWMEALIAEREGRLDDARGLLRFVYDVIMGSARLIESWIGPDLVRILLTVGDVAGADEVVGSQRELAARARVTSAHGTALLCDALVQRHRGAAAGATAAFREAADLLRRAQRRPHLLMALDALDVRSDDAERAALRAHLGLGAAPMPASSAATTGATDLLRFLTPTERRVAALVAEGLDNTAVAVRVGVSKRTVEYHVSNLYAKLAVTTRTQLANAVAATSA